MVADARLLPKHLEGNGLSLEKLLLKEWATSGQIRQVVPAINYISFS